MAQTHTINHYRNGIFTILCILITGLSKYVLSIIINSRPIDGMVDLCGTVADNTPGFIPSTRGRKVSLRIFFYANTMKSLFLLSYIGL